ncbi:MAG: 3-hydroxyacyl-CoA dehydrogenase NAD-binding domain-containing protein [bacterium]|nr:3-hydroxyacyl-CoA dehydrogenase NAD-binding domain-containing protein [bacterium]
MTYNIRKAAVIGSGTMGGGIATVLAGVGIPTLLLDIPAKGTNPGDAPAKRNAVVSGNLASLQKMRPPQLFSPAVLNNISIGNIDDDLDKVADADWIIEVVVERLDIKQNLMAKLAEVAHPNAIITTNTSGIPIKNIAEGLGQEFTRRFMGTHFFNPPRYLYLLEVIPHEYTDPEAVQYMVDFATHRLGKGVVVAKDRPNFIGNRFMSMMGMQTMAYALDNGFTVEEVDALTGPLIGRPKTATYRLNDLVGFDIAVGVARNLYAAIADDPAREILNHPAAQQLSQKMLDNNWLGNKSGQGFYKQVKGPSGEREFWVLNLDTFEYEAPKNPELESVKKHEKVRPTGERIKRLMAEEDRAGQFLWHTHAFYLAYASHRVPEITDSIVNIDNAQKWGFSHEMGPFEIWDAIGVEESIPAFEAAGYPVADWVRQMVANGGKTFYQRDADGNVTGYYSPQSGGYVQVEDVPRKISLKKVKSAGAKVDGNSSASLWNVGDGVLLWEFHSQGMAIDGDLVAMGYRALELLEKPEWEAVVVGHEGSNFCVGANIFMVAMAAQNDALDQLEQSVKDLQYLTQAMRYAPKPVVVAPFSQALGGGAELIMAGSAVISHMELYAGLVEVGVGVVPAGGGMKELVRRVISPLKAANENNDILPQLQDIFTAVATAKVSASALEAREIGILGKADRIVMNRDYLLGEAKAYALELADGYVPQTPGKVWAAGRDAYAALLLGIEGFREGGYASEYDAHISRKIAYVMTGGALSQPQWVSEDYFLTLEREAFLSLVPEQKTLDRISYMLMNKKPLRN